jgi:hypothetical protein
LLGITFPAQTLLFNPPTINRKITTAGAQAWTVACRFSYRASGWNKSWRAATQQWEQVYYRNPSGSGSTAPYNNFSTADFSQVLA